MSDRFFAELRRRCVCGGGEGGSSGGRKWSTGAPSGMGQPRKSMREHVRASDGRFSSWPVPAYRRYYTTPKSYLDLINLYIQLLKEKRCVSLPITLVVPLGWEPGCAIKHRACEQDKRARP
jgi:hypothetical protein